MRDKRYCREKVSLWGLMKDMSELSMSSLYRLQNVLTFLSLFPTFPCFHLFCWWLFPSSFLNYILLMIFSPWLYLHLSDLLALACSFVSLSLSRSLALSAGEIDDYKPAVREKWLDPSSSRTVIFSPCAVACNKPGLRKPVKARLSLCESRSLCCLCTLKRCFRPALSCLNAVLIFVDSGE